MANHFNDLLLETLKEIRVRLDRLEGRADRLIEQKADKSDVAAIAEKLDQKADKSDIATIKSDVAAIAEKLDQKADKSDIAVLSEAVHSHGQRLDRIEAGIKTLQWTMTAGIAVIGLVLALFKAC